jgi:hypothetical protein
VQYCESWHENFLYFFEVLYALFILEYRLLILTVVVSTLTILHKTECNFFWFSLNFSKASTTRRFFNGNGCFDILTGHFFINIKQKYLPDMLNMEIKTRNIWMFLKMILNSMYMWSSYKTFPSLKKNKYVLNAHETKPYKTRYDYNLTIMKSPKPATDNRFKWTLCIVTNSELDFLRYCGDHFENGDT